MRFHAGTVPEWLRERSGCPLACFENTIYKLRETSLGPKDLLFLYTDGVTEAMNVDGELFGEKRLVSTLVSAAALASDGLTPAMLDKAVNTAVSVFADDAPQADDMTVLVIQYLEMPKRYMRTFSCTPESLGDAAEYLSSMLDKGECPAAAKAHLMVALDEVTSNVVRCSGASGIALEVRFSNEPRGVVVSVSDDGKPFNPLHVPEPDTKVPLEERPIGGLGILLLRKTMNEVSYHYAHGCNILTFRKNFV